MEQTRPQIADAPFGSVLRLADELELDPVVAQFLVRRGLSEPADAARFLSASDQFDASQFDGIDAAVEMTLGHAKAGSTIMIHGDYDVDGVCSTVILVSTLRQLGATVEWFIPGRREDGYGLGMENVEQFAAGPASLLITVDCAITAVDEVARARELGLDVVVTDHHRPRDDGRLPDAPIVHPLVCGYPDPELCATGVAYKFAQALRVASGSDPAAADIDLDLVALATIADCVPLVLENRRLVRDGLIALAQTQRPGLRALMRVAQVDPATVDETAIGFRLAPRINAAGRMQRADSGVELMLTDDPSRADAIADELDHANSERKLVEARIRYEAEAQAAALGPRDGYVLASDDWHPGVIGIVASRLAETQQRPVVIIALDGQEGSGSGRSVPGFDLLAAMQACSGDLLRFGGHRAAAGCTVAASSVASFAQHFEEYCATFFADAPLGGAEHADAIAGADGLSIELAEQLAALGPFGIGNPKPRLLIPAARLDGARSMGEGKHLRCTINSAGLRVSAVAFGTPRLPEGAETGLDVIGSLEVNRWRGAEELRFVIAQTTAPTGELQFAGRPADYLEAMREARSPTENLTAPESVEHSRELLDRRGCGIGGVLASLVASGESLLVITANEERRRAQLDGRFGSFSLTSWPLVLADSSLCEEFTHLVALDPPPSASAEAILGVGNAGTFAHQLWGPAELRFSLDEIERSANLRASLAELYRALRDSPSLPLLDQLRSAEPQLTPLRAALLIRVLEELELASFDGEQLTMLAEETDRRELEDSTSFLENARATEEARAWLSPIASLAA